MGRVEHVGRARLPVLPVRPGGGDPVLGGQAADDRGRLGEHAVLLALPVRVQRDGLRQGEPPLAPFCTSTSRAGTK